MYMTAYCDIAVTSTLWKGRLYGHFCTVRVQVSEIQCGFISVECMAHKLTGLKF
jgi:hypothetical protein